MEACLGVPERVATTAVVCKTGNRICQCILFASSYLNALRVAQVIESRV
jgi:hypothetical protein